MAWKPKEPELSPEEAIAKAIEEGEKYWFNSEPLFTTTKLGKKYSLFQLDASFTKTPWLILFFDFTCPHSAAALTYIKEWTHRFEYLNIRFLLVLRVAHILEKFNDSVRFFLRNNAIHFPAVLDHDGSITKTYGVDQTPDIILSNDKEIHFKANTQVFSSKIENKIHTFLRLLDPGLSTLPLFEPNVKEINKSLKITTNTKNKIYVPVKAFVKEEGNFKSGSFPDTGVRSTKPGLINLTGNWKVDEHKLLTSDPTATLSFKSMAPGCSIVAEAISKDNRSSSLIVEADGSPIYDIFAQKDILFHEEGYTHLDVQFGRIYSVFDNLPKDKCDITMRFPRAGSTPVAVYALWFFQ